MASIDPVRYDQSALAAFRDAVDRWEISSPGAVASIGAPPGQALAQQLIGPDAATTCTFVAEAGGQVLQYEGHRMPVEITARGVVRICGETAGRLDPNLGCVGLDGRPISPEQLAARTRFNLDYFLGDQIGVMGPQQQKLYADRRAKPQLSDLDSAALPVTGVELDPDTHIGR